MRPDLNKVLHAVCRDWSIQMDVLLGSSKNKSACCARKDAATRLRGAKLTIPQISHILNRSIGAIENYLYDGMRERRAARLHRDKHCAICGVLFLSRGNAKTCSIKCSADLADLRHSVLKKRRASRRMHDSEYREMVRAACRRSRMKYREARCRKDRRRNLLISACRSFGLQIGLIPKRRRGIRGRKLGKTSAKEDAAILRAFREMGLLESLEKSL